MLCSNSSYYVIYNTLVFLSLEDHIYIFSVQMSTSQPSNFLQDPGFDTFQNAYAMLPQSGIDLQTFTIHLGRPRGFLLLWYEMSICCMYLIYISMEFASDM